MQKITKHFNIKVSTAIGAAIFFVFALSLAVVPRHIEQTKAESCSPLYDHPIFNPYPTTYNNSAGSDCTDFATGSGHLVGSDQYSHNITANAGDEIVVRMYIHNGAAQGLPNDQTIAKNIQLTTFADAGIGSTHIVGGTFTGQDSQGNQIAPVSGNIEISTGPQDHVEVIPGSGAIYNYNAQATQSGLTITDNGVIQLGDQQACFEYSRQIIFKIRIVGAPVVAPQGGGQISTANNGQIGSQCLLDGKVTWSTQNIQQAQVTVQTTGTGEQVYSNDTSGVNQDAPWITPGQDYVFRLYNQDNGHTLLNQSTLRGDLNCGTTPPVQQAGTGQISAYNNGQVGSQCLLDGKITWTTQNVANAKVTVSDPSDAERLYSNDLSGSNQDAPWLTPGVTYTFNLYNVDTGIKLATTQVSGNLSCNTPPVQQAGTGQISASNNGQIGSQCLLDGKVTWSTQNVTSAKVTVSDPYDAERLYSNDLNGTNQDAPWLTPGVTYTFNLYNLTTGAKLATTQVSGNLTCTTPVKPATLQCTPGNQNVNINQIAQIGISGGTAPYSGTASDNAPVALSGTSASASFTTSGNKTITIRSTDGQTASCNVSVAPSTPVGPVCTINSNVNLTHNAITQIGTTGVYQTTVSYSFSGSNPMRITYVDQNGAEQTFVANTTASGNLVFNQIQPGVTYLFKIYDSSSCGSLIASMIVRQEPVITPACIANSNYALNISQPSLSGNVYSLNLNWSSTGNNQIRITQNNPNNIVINGNNTGTVAVNNLQPGTSYTFYMTDVSCGTLLTATTVVTPQLPVVVTPASTTTTINTCVNNSCNNTNTNTNTNTVYINNSGSTVPANQFGQLSITKLVRNSNSGSSFAHNTNANNNDTVQFQITVQNVGNQTVNNVRLTDILPSGLNFQNGSISLDNSNSSNSFTNSNGLYIGNMTAGQTHVVVFQAQINSGVTTTIQNTAQASGDNTSTVQDSAFVFLSNPQVLGGSVNLTYSKKAFNETKGADATSVPASKEDFITYTLTVTNTGNTPATSFVITDDLSQVLPYGEVVDNGGGSLNGNVISYPGITVPANGSVSRSFKVRVKYFLADNLNYVMTNTYGNTVTININTPQVKGAFIAPKTGANTIAFTFAGLITGSFALLKKRKALMAVILN